MPELPEVQCVVNTLRRVVGKKIKSVDLLTDRLRESLDPGLVGDLSGRIVRSIYRRAKYIIFELDRGFLVVHLGMTGKLVINMDAAKHDRVFFELDDGISLRYNDSRKFGLVMYEEHLEHNKYLKSLGVEPLSDEFNGEWLYSSMQCSAQTAKQFLLDQKKIAGLGNIYANELLYVLKIHPYEPVQRLNLRQAEDLAFEIKSMLIDSINKGGSSISDYRDANNKKGSFQESFHVYQRNFDLLGNPVVSINQNSRSTFYCPSVQILS
jgi:formamidopyrimidine-DNA glycosylase